MKHKIKKRIRFIFLFLAASAAIIFILDNAAIRLYPVKYSDIVQIYSQKYELDPLLVFAIIKVESNFKPDAVSPKNAMGLMQITEKTGSWGARKLNITKYDNSMLYLPETNIRIGCWYLSTLYNEFGETDLVLAAYNGGSGNVKQWLGDSNYSASGKSLDLIPFKETALYLNKVKNSYNIYKKLYENQF